jgi:hypothetical protein
VSTSLNLPSCTSVRSLTDEIETARLQFEALLNNVGDDEGGPRLSIQGGAIDILLSAVGSMPHFHGKHFFFLIDEYENLLDYQQQVMNTLIKHSSTYYTFKVSVRELGLRRRSTLNLNEQLISPADYIRINIAEKLGQRFGEFARQVCNTRLVHAESDAVDAIRDVTALLGELSEEEEARLLGVDERLGDLKATLAREGTEEDRSFFENLPPLKAYFIEFWTKSQNQHPLVVLRDLTQHPKGWEERFENYRHSILFTIRKGKRGIRKYYAGWDVFTKLAAGNIRYLLELVEQSLVAHLRNGERISIPVSFETQTIAAQSVGRKNITELEGISVHGARLTRLLLSLGRVFQVMAGQPEGHTPEANQFTLREEAGEPGTLEQRKHVDELLRSAVMHLALLRFPGNKLQDEADTRAYDYMIHPLFSAFFEFSHRRKRKITLTEQELLGLVTHPRRTISEILRQQHRSVEEPLPDQLRLFEGYYAGGE